MPAYPTPRQRDIWIFDEWSPGRLFEIARRMLFAHVVVGQGGKAVGDTFRGKGYLDRSFFLFREQKFG